MEQGMFGAGCFWGVQYYFDQVPGVIKTTVGYSGGHTKNPSYEEVCTHTTGHAEVVLVEFDPKKISFEVLVKQFFKMHDPTQLNRQGPDFGDDYRTAIFYFDDKQQEIAEKVKKESAMNFEQPIVTEITKAAPFYEAEDYHQKFAERTGRGMCYIPYSAVT